MLSEKNLPYKILMQQPGSSQDKVLNEFCLLYTSTLDQAKVREIEDYYDRCAVEGANEHQIEESQKAVADRKSTRLNSSHSAKSRMPSSA